jgi:hypothetical protein
MVFNPFNEGWMYRKNITIDHTKVAADLENFPVLIRTIDVDLQAKAQIDGDDILFMDGPGVATRLYHEIEYYDSSTGDIVVWVNASQLSSTMDTIQCMYYGNLLASNQQCEEKVWNHNYQGVWHLSEQTSSSLRYDSTINQYHGIPYNYDGDEGTLYGKIDGADNFDGSNDHIRTSATFDYEYRTISFWVNTERIPSSDRDQILNQASDKLLYGSIGAGIKPAGYLSLNSGGDQNPLIFPINKNTWYFAHMIRNGPTTEYYVDGILEHTSVSTSIGSSYYANEKFVIATDRAMNRRFFDGSIDEIRVTDNVLTEGWIFTEYTNQNNPNTFYTIGLEETGP